MNRFRRSSQSTPRVFSTSLWPWSLGREVRVSGGLGEDSEGWASGGLSRLMGFAAPFIRGKRAFVVSFLSQACHLNRVPVKSVRDSCIKPSPHQPHPYFPRKKLLPRGRVARAPFRVPHGSETDMGQPCAAKHLEPCQTHTPTWHRSRVLFPPSDVTALQQNPYSHCQAWRPLQ